MTPKLYAAIKWGALLGGPLAILEAVIAINLISSNNDSDQILAFFTQTLLEAAIPLAAGWLAARETGEARSGLIAGLAAGIVVALVNSISELVLPQGAPPPDAPPLTAFDLVANWILFRAITLGLGAWGGWLGGRLHENISNRLPPR